MSEATEDDTEQPASSGQAAEEGHGGPPERIVEFGWVDNRPVTGRRAVKDKEKKKIKAGSFGTPLTDHLSLTTHMTSFCSCKQTTQQLTARHIFS